MKRSETIIFRATPKERKIIEGNAIRNDLTISEYLRYAAINTKEVKIEAIQHEPKKPESFLDLENIFSE